MANNHERNHSELSVRSEVQTRTTKKSPRTLTNVADVKTTGQTRAAGQKGSRFGEQLGSVFFSYSPQGHTY